MLVIIGADNRCRCSCVDPCPLNKRGSDYRCTKEELESAGHETLLLRFCPCGGELVLNEDRKGLQCQKCTLKYDL